MELNIESMLNNTRKLLQELGNAVSSLVNSSPDIFEDQSIKSHLKDFLDVYQEAVQRLENPSFRIATIGTTSSGKSTIVNALIGRKIAPIEAGEMSGGVLTLKHSQEHRLMIAETKDAAWDTGEWTGLSDEDLYQRIRTVMHTYHDARKKGECVAPQIIAHVPLLPACNASLLGLPKVIEVELIDLPGLKSIQDRTNLATIQKQVNKAFSLVALDYMQVDDGHRKRLLEELNKVVGYLQGRTDSMIFILNRVDQRGSDDLPLSVCIDKLREEIKDVLSLSELPDILPFSARLLYYAQCAWGSEDLNEPSLMDQVTRLRFLNSMFQDCAGVIRSNSKENRDLKHWFRDIEEQVEENEPIDDEKMRQILRYVLEWSGGKHFWDCLRLRVKKKFAELVISPALWEVFANYDVLASNLDILIQARKISDRKEVEQERAKLARIRQDLPKNIKKISQKFKTEIEQLIEGLNTDDPEARIKIKEKQGYKGFSVIFDADNEVVGHLTKVLIVPVRDAFKNNQGAYELEEELGKVISPFLAEDIAKAYEHVSHRISTFSTQSEYLVKCVRADDDKAKRELKHDERYIRLLYHTMRKAISARAEFFLQTKTKQCEQALESLVDEQVKRLKVCLSEVNFSSINLEEAAFSNLRKSLAQNPLTLPEKLFELPDTIKQDHSKKTEVVDTETKNETYIEYYQEDSCLKSTKTRPKTRSVTVNVTEDVEYIELI